MSSLPAHSLRSSPLKPPQLPPRHSRYHATLRAPPPPKNKPFSLPNLEELIMPKSNNLTTHKHQHDNNILITTKLLAIAEAAADRAEMHAIIGKQRDNWNHLLLHSINSITLSASLMAAITPATSQLSSSLLFASSAALMLVVNKIQPSQLAEEQRNAARLFKQLKRSIHTNLSLGHELNVEEAMDKVLALQKAYPLPLLPGMLEKFPKKVEPTKWWPKQRRSQQKQGEAQNGWSSEMEDEMRGVLRVLKIKDEEQYVRVGELVLNINKMLSFVGPLLAGVAAVGAAASVSWVAVVGGAVAAVVNAVEHGGQVGMVFELCRNCAGYYRMLEEEIEFNLGEEMEMREQGEIFEVKMALQLGRSLSEIRRMASYSAPESGEEEIQEFAGKLF